MATLDRLPFIAPGNPSLDLNFAAGQALIRDALGAPARPVALDTLLTFSRPSPAWGFGPDGLLGQYAADVLRFTSDPVSRAPRGVRLESASANLALWSNAFGNAVYTATNLTLFGTAVQGIDGRNSGTRVVDGGSGGSVGTLAQTVTISGNGWYSGGIFVRPVAGATQFRVRATLNGGSSVVTGNATFDLATGLVLSATGVVGRCRPGPNGLYRIEAIIQNTVGATGLTVQVERANASDTGVSYDINEMQIEARYALSSPIPTTSAPVTRAADRLSMPIGPWWVPIEGSITVEFVPQGNPGAGQQILALRNDAATVNIGIGRSQFGPSINLGATGGASLFLYGADNDVPKRASFRAQSGAYAGAMGGSIYLDSGVATSTGTVPSGLTVMDIGHFNGSNQLDGTLQRIVVESTSLSNLALSNRVR